MQSLAPGALLLAAFAVLLHTNWLALTLPTLAFLFYAGFALGLLLAWRFHSGRVFFALTVLFLARQAIIIITSSGRLPLADPGRTAIEVCAFLVPLNFVLLSVAREQGFVSSSAKPAGLLLFVEAVVVFVLGRIGGVSSSLPAHAHRAAVYFPLPAYVWAAFAVAGIVLWARFFLFRKPVESALFWSLCTFALAVHFAGTAQISTGYFAAATLILAASVVETSYLLAFHDELTTLPSRRAFNDALLHLQAPYSIAMVDIDHFKKFNDTYGHDTGDQVLRLVASKLTRVTGGGEAFRCGGEEFAILFSGKTTREVVDHLEQLRAVIEAASFRRRKVERRQVPRGPDRRNQRPRGRGRAGHAIRQLAQTQARSEDRFAESRSREDRSDLSVTVSIGVATSGKDEADPNRVIQAADKALYRAKAAGRNRVETTSAGRRRGASTKTAEIA